jgi:hypothetical protein
MHRLDDQPVKPASARSARPSLLARCGLIGAAAAIFLAALAILGLAAARRQHDEQTWSPPGNQFPPNGPAQAIDRVRIADENAAQNAYEFHRNHRTSLEDAFTRVVLGMEAIDLSGCPPDFQAAYREHIRAWGRARDVVAQYPQEFNDWEEWNRINDLPLGPMNATSMIEAHRASDQILATFVAVSRIARTYGVLVPVQRKLQFAMQLPAIISWSKAVG